MDIPYFDQGGDLKDYPDFKEDMHNITEHIPDIVNWLSDKGGYQESDTYATVLKNNYNNETRARSYALRLLIHYMGDVHQPLHALSRINPEFPAGDRGGNSFPLKNHYSIAELHAAWDSVIYEFHTNDKLVSFYTNWFIFNSKNIALWWGRMEQTGRYCYNSTQPLQSRSVQVQNLRCQTVVWGNLQSRLSKRLWW